MFHFFIMWKTGNQLKICLVHLLADKNAYVGHSLNFCHGFKSKRL